MRDSPIVSPAIQDVRGRVSKAWPGGLQTESSYKPRRPIEYVYKLLAKIPRRVMFLIALLGHDAMQARQLRGIKKRAEEAAHAEQGAAAVV